VTGAGLVLCGGLACNFYRALHANDVAFDDLANIAAELSRRELLRRFGGISLGVLLRGIGISNLVGLRLSAGLPGELTATGSLRGPFGHAFGQAVDTARRLVLVTLSSDGPDGVESGNHLRWQFDTTLGFPQNGFDVIAGPVGGRVSE